MTYTAEIIQSMGEISQKAWNALSTGISTEHAWHQLAEEADVIPIVPRHIIVKRNGSIVAIAATYIQTKALGINVEQSLFGRFVTPAHMLGVRLNPCLLCHSPMTVTGSGLLFHKKLTNAQKKECLDLIIEHMQHIVQEEGLVSYGFLNPADTTLLSKRDFTCVTPSAEVSIAVPWKSFQEYLGSMSRSRRKNVKWEMNTLKKEGIVIKELWSLKGHYDQLSDLFNNTYEKYRPGQGWISPGYLQLLEKKFPNRVCVNVAEKDGHFVAACLNIVDKDMIFCYRAGKDNSSVQAQFGTFCTVIYHSIQMAIQRGIKQLWLGTGSYDYKMSRGGHATPAPLFIKRVKATPLLRPALSLIHTIKQKRLAQWYAKNTR